MLLVSLIMLPHKYNQQWWLSPCCRGPVVMSVGEWICVCVWEREGERVALSWVHVKNRGLLVSSEMCSCSHVCVRKRVLTWPLGTFWANSVCLGSFVSWTIGALVLLNSRSACKDLLLKSKSGTKRYDLSIQMPDQIHSTLLCVFKVGRGAFDCVPLWGFW